MSEAKLRLGVVFGPLSRCCQITLHRPKRTLTFVRGDNGGILIRGRNSKFKGEICLSAEAADFLLALLISTRKKEVPLTMPPTFPLPQYAKKRHDPS